MYICPPYPTPRQGGSNVTKDLSQHFVGRSTRWKRQAFAFNATSLGNAPGSYHTSFSRRKCKEGSSDFVKPYARYGRYISDDIISIQFATVSVTTIATRSSKRVTDKLSGQTSPVIGARIYEIGNESYFCVV